MKQIKGHIPFIVHEWEMLHEKRKKDYICFRLKSTLGEEDNSCDVVMAGFEWGGLDCTPFFSVPSALAMDVCSKEAPGTGKFNIKLHNSLSPEHTLLQIWCMKRRALMYDWNLEGFLDLGCLAD
ncbi:hypothetical protein GOP47_0006400 [Adiantum capillus-veneris]|uniref:Uncharacterized protein n=1 Tax=Adiantum capillus-veneris TaxID=13818 RepID=A0A9D4ZKD0_ADICA|nr:hypothetical protein GOP47_0006400 [Adiantum capillus-veneris]